MMLGHSEVHGVADVSVRTADDQPFGRCDRGRRSHAFDHEPSERGKEECQPSGDQRATEYPGPETTSRAPTSP